MIAGVHGYLGSAQTLERLQAHLEARYRVLLYDQRGHGRSERPVAGTDDENAALYSLERLARDLHELLAALGLDGRPVILAGHSMGGFVIFTCYFLFLRR